MAEIEIDIAEQIYQKCEEDPALANSILVLIRESLSNAVRHGRASQIWITGTVNNQIIEIQVKDDGQLKPERTETGLGSKIYAKLTTSWELTRSSDDLTVLSLQIPMATKQDLASV